MADPMTRDEFVAFVRGVGRGVVATVDPAGEPEAAYVELAVSDEGDLVFDSRTAARKVRNIETHPRVAVVIGWDDGVSVQVEGAAAVLDGPEREAFGALYSSQFPGTRALDDGFSVIRVTPEWVRHYDVRQRPPLVVEGECW